jgi:hypothetical protein
MAAAALAVGMIVGMSGVASAANFTASPVKQCTLPADTDPATCYSVTYSQQSSYSNGRFTVQFSAWIQRGSSGVNFAPGNYNTPWGTLGAMHATAYVWPTGGSKATYSLTTCGQQAQGTGIAIWCSASWASAHVSGVYGTTVKFDWTFLDTNNFGYSLPNTLLA